MDDIVRVDGRLFRRRLFGYDVGLVDAFAHEAAVRERTAESERKRAQAADEARREDAAAWDRERRGLEYERDELRAELADTRAELERARAGRAQVDELIRRASEAVNRAKDEAHDEARRVVADAEARAREILAEATRVRETAVADAERIVETAERDAQARLTAVLVEFECIESVRSHASDRLSDLAGILSTARSMLESIPLPKRDDVPGATVLDLSTPRTVEDDRPATFVEIMRPAIGDL